jgi:hypothetical protein
VSPATLILAPAPKGYAIDKALVPGTLGKVLADRSDAGGRHLVIRTDLEEIQFSLPSRQARRRPFILIPKDKVADFRMAVATRVLLRLRGVRGPLLPPKLQLTARAKTLHIHRLRAYDISLAGGSARDVGKAVRRSDDVRLRAVEWKNSSTCQYARRLIHSSRALVTGGYLQLLRAEEEPHRQSGLPG